MSVHFERLSTLFRCYAPGDSFEAGSEPICTGVVNRSDTGKVEIMAGVGNLTMADMRDIVTRQAEDGVHTIRIKRRKGHRVPCGRLVESTALFDIYELSPADVEARP